jgi:hypothetical protein
MNEEPEFEVVPFPEDAMILYTLCVDGTAIATCAIGAAALEKDVEGTMREAFFETWAYGGGDLMRLVGRSLKARRPTKREKKEWLATTSATGKPYCVFAGGHEARGAA